MKKIIYLLAVTTMSLLLNSCCGDCDESTNDLSVVSVYPAGDEVLNSSDSVVITYSEALGKNFLNGKVYVNDESVDYSVSGNDLIIKFSVTADANYNIMVAAGAVYSVSNQQYCQEYTFSVNSYSKNGAVLAYGTDAMPSVVEVYQFLSANFGKKTLSGTMLE